MYQYKSHDDHLLLMTTVCCNLLSCVRKNSLQATVCRTTISAAIITDILIMKDNNWWVSEVLIGFHVHDKVDVKSDKVYIQSYHHHNSSKNGKNNSISQPGCEKIYKHVRGVKIKITITVLCSLYLDNLQNKNEFNQL